MKFVETRKQAKTLGICVVAYWTCISMIFMYFLGIYTGLNIDKTYSEPTEILLRVSIAIGILVYSVITYLICIATSKYMDWKFPVKDVSE